jgi:hypothetical protein
MKQRLMQRHNNETKKNQTLIYSRRDCAILIHMLQY